MTKQLIKRTFKLTRIDISKITTFVKFSGLLTLWHGMMAVLFFNQLNLTLSKLTFLNQPNLFKLNVLSKCPIPI